MAITNYSELTTAVQNWAALSDATFTARIDEFIALCEDRVHYGSGEPGEQYYTPPLRVMGLESTADLTVSSQEVSQPSGFLQARRLYLNTNPKVDLDHLMPDRFWASKLAATSTSGKPKIYTIEGSNFVFGPSPDDTYTGKLLYYAKMTGLSGSNTTNWLITNSPGTYLYGTLLEAMIYDKNDKEAQKYFELYKGRMVSLKRQDKLARHSGGTLRQIPDKVA